MINLLSEEAKNDLRAARSNVTLLNYMLVLGLGVLFLAFICIGVYFILMGTKANAEKLISENASKDTSQGAIQAQNAALRKNLADAKAILDQEVVYSKFVTNIAALMPSGVVLDNLSLSPSTFGSPTSLQFFAVSTEAALSLKEKFETSPFFSGVNFQSLTSNTNEQSSAYPISATLGLVINKGIAQ